MRSEGVAGGRSPLAGVWGVPHQRGLKGLQGGRSPLAGVWGVPTSLFPLFSRPQGGRKWRAEGNPLLKSAPMGVRRDQANCPQNPFYLFYRPPAAAGKKG